MTVLATTCAGDAWCGSPPCTPSTLTFLVCTEKLSSSIDNVCSFIDFYSTAGWSERGFSSLGFCY
jgi:hypothetical protein